MLMWKNAKWVFAFDYLIVALEKKSAHCTGIARFLFLAFQMFLCSYKSGYTQKKCKSMVKYVHLNVSTA